MDRYEKLLEKSDLILKRMNTVNHRMNEVAMTAKESEDVVVDLINAIANKEPIPSKYEGRGFEPLYDSLKQYVRSTAEVYGKKKLSTSELWKNVTGKSVDTSKTDVKGDRNYSVKYGPAQLMSGATLEAEATFVVAAQKSGLSSMAQGIALDMLEELQSFSGKTIGPDMDVTKLKKEKKASDIKDEINKKAFKIIRSAENSQKAFQKYMNDLFSDNQKFRLEFIYEAMTGNSKFSDTTAIADTMLCINKNATKVKIEVVTSADDSYVKRVSDATKIDVNFKTGSYGIGGKKAGYNFYTAVRLATKDLSSSVGEMNEAFDKYKNKVDEGVLDLIKPFIDKVKSAWDRLKNIFVKGIELIKKGFVYVMSVFQLSPEVTGWEELDTIDLYELA